MILQWNMDFLADSVRFSCVQVQFRQSTCCTNTQHATEKYWKWGIRGRKDTRM